MVSNRKQRAILCAALVSLGNIAHAMSIDDFFNNLFETSLEPSAPEKKQSWADIQKEIDATTPRLHEVAYLLDQIHDKNRENLAATLTSIDNTQQQLANVRTRLENHIATSNDFDIQEEQTTDALTIHIATPGFDSQNITAMVNAEEKSLCLSAHRSANNTFSYSSTECNSSTGRQSAMTYENGTLNVMTTLPDNIDYMNHTVTFGDDEVIITFPFSKEEIVKRATSENLDLDIEIENDGEFCNDSQADELTNTEESSDEDLSEEK